MNINPNQSSDVNFVSLSRAGNEISDELKKYANPSRTVADTKKIKEAIIDILFNNSRLFTENDFKTLEKTKDLMEASNKKMPEENSMNKIKKEQKWLNERIIRLTGEIIEAVKHPQEAQPSIDLPRDVIDIILSNEILTKEDIHNAKLVDKKFNEASHDSQVIANLLNKSKENSITFKSTVELYDLLNKFGEFITHLDLRSLLGDEMQYINGATIVQILKKCPNLKSLDLGGCTRGIDLDNISKFLPTSLESLTFDKTKIHNFHHFLAMIEKLPNSKFLSLAGCVESEGRNITIAEGHVPINNLEGLNLSKCKAFDTNAVSTLVGLCPNLKRLNIANTEIANKLGIYSPIMQLIAMCEQLEHLTVTGVWSHMVERDFTFKQFYEENSSNTRPFPLIIEEEDRLRD